MAARPDTERRAGGDRLRPDALFARPLVDLRVAHLCCPASFLCPDCARGLVSSVLQVFTLAKRRPESAPHEAGRARGRPRAWGLRMEAFGKDQKGQRSPYRTGTHAPHHSG